MKEDKKEDIDFIKDPIVEDALDDDLDDEDGGNYGHSGCGYNGGYGNRSNSYNDFLNGKFNKW